MTVRPVSVRNLLWFLVCAAIVAVLVASRLYIGNKALAGDVVVGRVSAAILWKTESKYFLYYGFARGGKYVAAVEPEGYVSVYHDSGILKYRVKVEGADRAVVSPAGSMTMVYSYLNPGKTSVVFLDAEGKRLSDLNVQGSVWCSDSWERGGEVRFAVGTGKRQVYCIAFGSHGRNYHKWRAPGVVTTVSFEPDGDNLLYGTWQKSFLLRSTRKGTVRWSSAIDPAAIPEVNSLGDGQRWRVLIVPNRQGSDAVLRMFDEDCTQLWEKNVRGRDRSRILVSSSGSYTCIGYDKEIEHSGKAVLESHAMLMDRNGDLLWNKGTMFLKLVPLAVMDNGCVLAEGTGGKLLLVDQKGSVAESERLEGDIISSIWSPDTNRVLIECSDGYMYMIGVTSGS